MKDEFSNKMFVSHSLFLKGLGPWPEQTKVSKTKVDQSRHSRVNVSLSSLNVTRVQV